MGKQPLVKNKNYKLKIATQQVPVVLSEIISVLDASELSSIGNKPQVDRHDVAECVFETLKPVAFDEVTNVSETGRFVIVDNYEISGGGIILVPVFEEGGVLSRHIQEREVAWERSDITPGKRADRYQHKSAFVILTGPSGIGKKDIAKRLEERLFKVGKFVYFLGVSNDVLYQGAGTNDKTLNRVQHIQQLGETAHVLTDAGFVLITSISGIDDYELKMLKSLNRPSQSFVVNVGESAFSADSVDLQVNAGEGLDKTVETILNKLLPAMLPDPEYAI